MRATELRLNNNILDSTGRIVRVNRLVENKISVNDNGFAESEDLFSGIPLTEELLLKFGFTTEVPKYLKLRFNESVSDYILFDTEDKDFLFLRGSQDWLCKLEYVHQLQNLYFAVCGEELEIK